MRKKLIILSFLALSFTNLHSKGGQNLQFSQISTKEGLSQNTVRAILEDRKGFIWAGTLDGLNRYDGYRIVAYKPQPGNPNSLADHRVKDVFQDRDGYLWIKTYKNEFCCYNPVNDSFVNYLRGHAPDATYTDYHEASNGDIWLWGNTDGCLRVSKHGKKISATPFLTRGTNESKKSCIFLFEDSKSIIWIGGANGLYKITGDDTETFYEGEFSFTKAIELDSKLYFTTEEADIIEYDMKRRSFTPVMSSEKHGAILDAACLSNHELLLTTSISGVVSFNINNRKFSRPQWANDPQLTGNIQIITDKNKGIWLYNHSGIMWYYCQPQGKVKKLELIPPDIAAIIDLERYVVFIDSLELIWITTYGNGLFCYNPETDALYNYKYKPNQNSPASDYLLDITEDSYGNIWIGSEYAGIIKVVRANYDIEVIRPEKETSIGKNNNVRTVYSDANNDIWLGTKNGSLYVYNDRLTDGKCVYKDINPYAIAEDLSGRVWVGTKGNGLYIIDGTTHKEVAHYTSDGKNSRISHNTVFSIFKDMRNRMWVGTFGGGINLAEQTADGIGFRHFFLDDGNRSYIRYIYQDTKGMMWAGSSDGIIRFDPERLIADPKAYVSYRLDLNDKNSLNCNDIKTIYEDEDGVIWIGTAGGGINRYVPESGGRKEHFVAYTTRDGLSGDVVSGILEDREHNLWISTESGITKFNKKNGSFIVYNFSDKTYGNHFNENANIYSQNGNMLWGSLDGLLVFNPESFVSEINTTPVTLTNISIYEQTVKAGEKGSPLTRSISYSDKIKLNYKQNTFTIEFASLNMKNPAKNKYMYILDGYDKQWSAISNQNTATYKNLPHGKYVFRIRGINSDGVWHEGISTTEITITPPFWLSWYAYVLYALLALTISFIIVRLAYKFNALNNNIRVEKELTNHKLKFFTNISHEFRTPLTLIRGAVENLNTQTGLTNSAKKQVNVLSRNSVVLTRLIDQLLEFRKLQNNVITLDLEETDIVDFAKEIFNGFQELAAQKNIQYSFVSSTGSYKMYIDRRKMDKILYNLLSNAFKFTNKGGHIELSVSLNEAEKTCHIMVADNGIGVDRDKQHLLFSRFMQINFASSGTGVGLSIVKEFVEAHKGRVWYESNGEQGSLFNVEISTDQDKYHGENFITSSNADIVPTDASTKVSYPSEMAENIELPEIEDAALSNYKMLIIEDNDDIRNFLADEFSKYFMVETAEDGAKGLKKAIEINPDMIICDVMMPELDGFEVTRRLRDDFQTCHIPIILLTAHSSIEHQVEGIQSGADAYIMKPFSLRFLVARVFKLIEQREQLKKRFSNEYVLEGNLITKAEKDKEFYNMIDRILEEHMADSSFSVDRFAELSKLRRTIFYKKIKGITGLSPNELIKAKRMKRAAELLLQGELTVSEVSYKVGFEDQFYFSKCFKAQYKCSPSKYGQPADNK